MGVWNFDFAILKCRKGRKLSTGLGTIPSSNLISHPFENFESFENLR